MFLNSAHLVVLCTERRDMLQYCVKGLPYKMQRTLTKGVYIILMSIRMSYPWNLQELETVQEQLKVITVDLESMEVSMCSNHLNTSH